MNTQTQSKKTGKIVQFHSDGQTPGIPAGKHVAVLMASPRIGTQVTVIYCGPRVGTTSKRAFEVTAEIPATSIIKVIDAKGDLKSQAVSLDKALTATERDFAKKIAAAAAQPAANQAPVSAEKVPHRVKGDPVDPWYGVRAGWSAREHYLQGTWKGWLKGQTVKARYTRLPVPANLPADPKAAMAAGMQAGLAARAAFNAAQAA